MRHDRRIAGVRGLVHELQRPVGRRLKIEGGHKPSGVFFQHVERRMRVGEVELAARRQHGRNDLRPFLHIGQPANGAPGCEDEVERARRQVRSLIHGPLDEVRFQAGLIGQAPGNLQRGAGKIESGDRRAAPYQAQRIPADMALQMQNALAGDVAEFGRFNLVQGVLAGTKPVQHVIAGGIARMNGGALIPVPAVHFDGVGHVNSW